MIRKTVRKSLVEQVVLQIEQLIEKGHWQVGDKIPPEMELMKQFDVSRNTLREAIRALVHTGLLETRQGSGTIVQSASPLGAAIQRHIKKADLIDTLEVRLALEREAACLAASRRNVDDLMKMKRYIAMCKKMIEADNEAAFIEADIQFHKAIVKASHNKVLIDLYEHMTEILYHSVETLLKMRKKLNFQAHIHQDLFEAIQDGQVEQAVQCVNIYIDELQETLNKIKEDGTWKK